MKIAPLLLFLLALSLGTVAKAQSDTEGSRAAYEQAIEATKTAITSDPRAALANSDLALERATALPADEAATGRATALWLRIEAYIWLNRLDEAEAHLASALRLARRHAANSKLHGDLMRSRGAIAALRGDVENALRDYLDAFRIYRAADESRGQAIALQDIGNIYWEAGDYRRMLRYLDQAQQIYRGDPGFTLTTHNSRGEALRALGRGQDAEREYEAALVAAGELGSALLETRILSNLALVQEDQGKLAAANRSAQRALMAGASPEAAEWVPFVYGVMAKIAAAQGAHERAARLLERAFAGTQLDRTELVFKEFHELGASVYERLGKPDLALEHLKAFQRLDSQARDLTSNASSLLLAARFDFANQNLRISQLKQGQLERDVKIERQRVEFRTVLFTALAIAGAIVTALITGAFFSIRRSRNEVRAANIDLTRVNAALEKALKAKTDLLAMTSHELRTPLNGILGMAQVILARHELDSETREQVQLVEGAGETMRALVDDILDVAKMETGEVCVYLEPVDLHSIMKDAVRFWRGEAQNRNIELIDDFDPMPPLIETDGGKVRQIVFNLLSNAFKFTPNGQVRVVTQVDHEDARFRILVEDSGIGIAEDQHSLIFEAFHQVDCAMTRQFSGTGLGLAICRSLANALEGSIDVTSAPGKGSTFTVTLPLRTVSDRPVEERPARLADCRVVLIEANALKRATMRGLVAPHVTSVREAEHAEAGLELVAAGGVDLLIIDCASCAVLPELRPAALERLLIEARREGVLTCALLAPDDHTPFEMVAQLEPDRLLLKPLRGSALVEALHLILADAASIQLSQVA